MHGVRRGTREALEGVGERVRRDVKDGRVDAKDEDRDTVGTKVRDMVPEETFLAPVALANRLGRGRRDGRQRRT